MDHIYFIGIAEAISASMFLFARKNNKPSSFVAGLFIIFLSLPMISNMTVKLLSHSNVFLAILLHSAPFTFGPLLFIYTELIIAEEPQYKYTYIFHFIPFLIFTILLIAGLKINSPGINPVVPSTVTSPGFTLIIKHILQNISYISYTVLILLKLHSHRKRIGDYYSNETSEITLSWLYFISIVFMLCSIAISLLAIGSLIYFNYSFKAGIFFDYGLTFYIFIFSLFSVKQPDLYSKKMNVRIAPEKEKRYLKSVMTDENVLKYQNTLESIMKDEKLFLNNELTIDDVSDLLKIKRHHITQLLNQHLKVNFNTYINNYRLSYVIDKLKDETPVKQSILDLAMESGFNSKATFNRLFKSMTGITPSEYKKKVIPFK